jgi:hypothetical protein
MLRSLESIYVGSMSNLTILIGSSPKRSRIQKTLPVPRGVRSMVRIQYYIYAIHFRGCLRILSESHCLVRRKSYGIIRRNTFEFYWKQVFRPMLTSGMTQSLIILSISGPTQRSRASQHSEISWLRVRRD